MFNAEREWELMKHHKRIQVQQACSWRLQHEAVQDHISTGRRILIAISDLLIDAGTKLKTHCWKSVEKPHVYVAPPQDRIYA
jgi:hypothetical protein